VAITWQLHYLKSCTQIILQLTLFHNFYLFYSLGVVKISRFVKRSYTCIQFCNFDKVQLLCVVNMAGHLFQYYLIFHSILYLVFDFLALYDFWYCLFDIWYMYIVHLIFDITSCYSVNFVLWYLICSSIILILKYQLALTILCYVIRIFGTQYRYHYGFVAIVLIKLVMTSHFPFLYKVIKMDNKVRIEVRSKYACVAMYTRFICTSTHVLFTWLNIY